MNDGYSKTSLFYYPLRYFIKNEKQRVSVMELFWYGEKNGASF